MNCSFAGMNYLAHAYLSFDHPGILVGNMVSDFVKGAAKFSFNGIIQQGINLHRDIDSFTDTHPATREAKSVFQPAYRLYSGAIMDVLYDHFLANDPEHFDPESLRLFTSKTYQQLEDNAQHLPPRFLQVLAYMKTEDWLFHYSSTSGIRKSLSGLVRRAAFLTESTTAYNLFIEHYVRLKDCYQAFFPDVKQFAKQKFEAMDNI